VRKVTAKGGGAAIPARPRLLGQLVAAAVAGAAGRAPVTVKMRTGLSDGVQTYLEVCGTPSTLLRSQLCRNSIALLLPGHVCCRKKAKASICVRAFQSSGCSEADSIRRAWSQAGSVAEAEGAAAVSLHARTAEQLYDPPAAWDAVSRLVAAVSIPVLGNGDVFEVRAADGGRWRPTLLPPIHLHRPQRCRAPLCELWARPAPGSLQAAPQQSSGSLTVPVESCQGQWHGPLQNREATDGFFQYSSAVIDRMCRPAMRCG
jgi:Dihydrouridine synthase (Dus)